MNALRTEIGPWFGLAGCPIAVCTTGGSNVQILWWKWALAWKSFFSCKWTTQGCSYFSGWGNGWMKRGLCFSAGNSLFSFYIFIFSISSVSICISLACRSILLLLPVMGKCMKLHVGYCQSYCDRLFLFMKLLCLNKI